MWVDDYLKVLLLCYITCTNNSDNLLCRLKALNRASNNYCINASDTEGMCPHIKTEEGLAFFILALDSFMFKVNPQ